MRQDGGGQAMLAQRRAQRRADEEAMAEAVRTRPAGDDTPLRPPGADEPVGLQFDVAWLLEEPSEDERRFEGRDARRARRGRGATVVEEGVGVEHAAGGHVLVEEEDDEMLLLEELICDDNEGDADGGPPRRSIFWPTTCWPHRPPSASDRLSNVVEEILPHRRACSDF